MKALLRASPPPPWSPRSAPTPRTITLHGASQFNDDHAFTKAMVKFEELVEEVLRQADQLRDAQEQRARAREAVLRVHGAGQGRRLRDRLAGAHVDVLEGGAVIDAPFLFRDLNHWNKVLDADLLKPVATRSRPRPT